MCIFAGKNSKRPLPKDTMTVELRAANPEEITREKGFLKRIKKWLFSPFHFLNKVYRTALIIKYKEMSQPLAKTNDFQRFAIPFDTFFMNWQIIHHEPFMRALIKAPRNSGDPDGFFKAKHGIEAIVDFIRLIFPNEKITVDDCILTTRDKVSGPDGKWLDLLSKFRNPLLEFIGPVHVSDKVLDIYKIVTAVLSPIEGRINLEHLCRDYSCQVLSKILLGHPGPFEKIAEAVGFYSEWVIKAAQRRPLTAREKEKLQISLKTFRIEIDKVIKLAQDKCPNTEYVQSLLNNSDYTSAQIKAMLVILFFAGQETSSSLLTYFLWQLARYPAIQNDIKEDLEKIAEQEGTNGSQVQILKAQLESRKLNSALMEALRLFNPGYVINREAAKDLFYVIKESDEIVDEKFIPKGTAFFSCPFLAGRNPFKYADPEQFNPNRFESGDRGRNMSWLPFGFGKHACPGQWLALLEIKLFVIGFLKTFTFSTDKESVSFKGFMSLTIGEDIFVNVNQTFK